MEIAIARIKNKLIIFPTPRYARTKKREIDIAEISPLRVPAKRSEKVKSKVIKNKTKNRGIAKIVFGSIK
jgi:hypothetical protein